MRPRAQDRERADTGGEIGGACPQGIGGACPQGIQTTELLDGKVQAAYAATLEATGGTAPYSWTALSAMRTREASTWATYGQGGEATGWRASYGAWAVPLPFDFPFFGKTYGTAYINVNGVVGFEKAVSENSSEPQSDNVGLAAFGRANLHTGVWKTGVAGGNIYMTTNSTAYAVIR